MIKTLQFEAGKSPNMHKSTRVPKLTGADVSLIILMHREVKFTGHLFSKDELFFKGRHNLKTLFCPRPSR